jgi:hypothetical protein
MAVTSLIYAGRLDDARVRMAAMSGSTEPDARACAVWLPIELTEMEIAMSDDEQRLLERLADELDALEVFGREHAGFGVRFEDLILEAKLRRVHLEVRRGERMAAIRMVQEAEKLLDGRRRVRKRTPTYFYAEAVANLALTHAEWPMRAVLRIVGIKGDEERGKKAAEILLRRTSVYRPGVSCVIRSFAVVSSRVLGPPLDLSRDLHHDFPDNPVLTTDLAVDLSASQRCEEARAALTPLLERTVGMSDKMRDRIAGVLTSCSEAQASL